MFFYRTVVLIFIFIGCGGDTGSTKGLKETSSTNINLKSYSDLEKVKNEAKIRSIIIYRNVSKDFLKTEPPKHELSASYNLPSSTTCKDLKDYPVLVEGSGDFYKQYMAPKVGCTDINYINTDDSGDYMLIIAYGHNVIEENNNSTLLDLNAPNGLAELIKETNDYYKNPKKITTIAIKHIKISFNLERIRNEAKTKKVLIIRNVTEDYYKSSVLANSRVSISYYDISSNNITCKGISNDYVFNESMYNDYLEILPNHIIKDYRSKEYNTWCREWNSINAPESGNKSFLYTY